MGARRKLERRHKVLQQRINREVERQVALIPTPEPVLIQYTPPSLWERVKAFWFWLRTWG